MPDQEYAKCERVTLGEIERDECKRTRALRPTAISALQRYVPLLSSPSENLSLQEIDQRHQDERRRRWSTNIQAGEHTAAKIVNGRAGQDRTLSFQVPDLLRHCSSNVFIQQVLASTLARLQKDIAERAIRNVSYLNSGTTVAAAVSYDDTVVTAGLGDSEVLVYSASDKSCVKATISHNPNTLHELTRLRAEKAYLDIASVRRHRRLGGYWGIAVSRALGDGDNEKDGLSHTPSCAVVTGQDLRVICASDGVVVDGGMSPADVGRLAQEFPKNSDLASALIKLVAIKKPSISLETLDDRAVVVTTVTEIPTVSVVLDGHGVSSAVVDYVANNFNRVFLEEVRAFNPTSEIVPQLGLKAAVEKAQSQYEQWFSEKPNHLTFFSWKHHHGPAGQGRASAFAQQISESTSLANILELLKNLLEGPGNFHEHSFKTFLLREIASQCSDYFAWSNFMKSSRDDYCLELLSCTFTDPLNISSTINPDTEDNRKKFSNDLTQWIQQDLLQLNESVAESETDSVERSVHVM